MDMHIVAAAADVPMALESVLTAKASGEQMKHVFARMEPAGGLSAAGPVRTATIVFSTGDRGTLVFHERKNFIEILAPIVTGLEIALAEILGELDITADAVTWTHERLDLQAVLSRLAAVPHR
jgi:hypothetical protein